MIYFDKTCFRRSGKQNYLNIWVVCDHCGKGRWSQKANALVLPVGQPCKSCSNSMAVDAKRKHKDGYKQCCQCGNVYPITMFTRRADRRDSYRGCCKPCMGERARRGKLENPERIREQHRQAQRNRRARIRESLGSFTREDWQEIIYKYGHRCLCCGTQDDLQPDHVVPLSVGGPNVKDNIQPLCSKCNRQKQATIIDYRIGHAI